MLEFGYRQGRLSQFLCKVPGTPHLRPGQYDVRGPDLQVSLLRSGPEKTGSGAGIMGVELHQAGMLKLLALHDQVG
ncbi:hypothetical protein GCM10008955_14300 [Deinococcus malanensis]|uniref:Uncharacterized protein n=1 Tax=Deinococcus malanensis TaxID=1706855 RepID=A0ABQ2ES07_9DEIO|nr:hypothetical protein GCM10008955_14300 [Deinococcus malanensis]